MRPSSSSKLALALVAISLFATACGGRAATADDALKGLPVYEGKETELFPDRIEPFALGVSLDAPSYKADAAFQKKVTSSTFVVPAKVVGITLGKSEDRSTYTLQLSPTDAPLAGKAPPGEVELRAREGTSAYAVVAQARERARGKPVIAIVKRYREKDEAIYHFFVVADSPENREAVREALALRDAAGGK